MPYTYRLVQRRYNNRIENEDGPGSLQNIVSDRSDRVKKTWTGEDETFGQHLLSRGIKSERLYLPESRDDGWVDYSYVLERRLETDGAKWEFVDSVKPNASPEDSPEDDDSHRSDYLEEDDRE